ncbi:MULTISPECIES: hypothetical protein [unclassified Streptomyces]|uniref:hypothetical protein n=1 Tax=unclassified Streptomyces TaxID=2593676 RepID=UPI00381845E6
MPKKKQKKRRKPSGQRHHSLAQRELVPQPRASAPESGALDHDDLFWEAPEPAPEQSRGGAALNFDFASGRLPAVRMDFGEVWALERKRPIREGWGFSVELPAVLDLLQGISEQRFTADSAHGVLLRAADLLYDTFRCWEWEAGETDDARAECLEAGGCGLCRERRSFFDGLLNAADSNWQRLQQPETYPFTAGAHTIHQTTCSVVTRESPQEYSRPAGDSYATALNAFSHCHDAYAAAWDYERDRAYPRMRPMTPSEARAWIQENTGPRGGRNYKRCQRCAPAV